MIRVSCVRVCFNLLMVQNAFSVSVMLGLNVFSNLMYYLMSNP